MKNIENILAKFKFQLYELDEREIVEGREKIVSCVEQSLKTLHEDTVRECVGELEKHFTEWLKEFANRPIELRENAFNEVAEIRKQSKERLLGLIEKKT